MKAYEDDPLVYHGPLKAKWATEIMATIKMFRQRVGDVTLPLLIAHGTEDHLVPFTASQFVFANTSSADKTFEVNCPYCIPD